MSIQVKQYVLKTIVGMVPLGIVATIGFYVDFQGLKSRVFALEAKTDKISVVDGKVDQLRELICFMAIEKKDPNDKPESVHKYCSDYK